MNQRKLLSRIALCALLSTVVQAHALEDKYIAQVTSINTMDASGNANKQVFDSLVNLVDMLHQDLKVGQTVVNLNERFTEIRNEVITETYSSKESESYSASMWGLISGDAGMSSSSSHSYDTTKIISQNPMEAAEFAALHNGGRAASDIRDALNAYVASNSEKLVLLKEAGQKALEVATKLRIAGQPVPPAQIKRILRAVTQLHFYGNKQVTTCIQTNYTNRARDSQSDSNENASLSVFFLFGGSYSHDTHSESHWRQYAHSVKSCNSNVTSDGADIRELAYSINLSAEDDLIWQWTRAYFAFTNFDFSDDEMPVYPTFGNPLFRNP